MSLRFVQTYSVGVRSLTNVLLKAVEGERPVEGGGGDGDQSVESEREQPVGGGGDQAVETAPAVPAQVMYSAIYSSKVH